MNRLAAHAAALEQGFRSAAKGQYDKALTTLLTAAVDAVADIDGASVTATLPTPHTVASLTELDDAWNTAQYTAGSGPCLTAARTGDPVVIGVSNHRTREQFGDFLSSTPVEAMVSWPLPGQQAALSLLARASRDFSDDALEWIAVYAAAIGAVILMTELRDEHETDARVAAQLQSALDSRVRIEQAKGILMAQRRIPAHAAFRILAQASQRENLTIDEIAARVIDGVTR